MNAFLPRLIIVMSAIVLGVLVLAIGSCTLALGVAAFRTDPKKNDFVAAFCDAFCEITDSVQNPTTIGLQGRFERRVSVSSDGAIRFTSLPAHWRKICLTSVESGIAMPAGAIGDGVLFTLRSSICWGYAPSKITVFLIENINDTYPVQLKVPERVGAQRVLIDYTELRVPSGYSLCAPREEAVARCVALFPDAPDCIYLFPRPATEKR